MVGLFRNICVFVFASTLATACADGSHLDGPFQAEPFASYRYINDGTGPAYAAPAAMGPFTRQAVGYKPNPIEDVRTVADYRRVQDNYLAQFAETAGVGGTAPSRKYWSATTRAGFNYLDGVCQDYLRQVYRLREYTLSGRRSTGYAGFGLIGAAGALFPEFEHTGRLLSLLATAFGLGLSAFDIRETGLLPGVEYSAIYRLVKQQHLALRQYVDRHGLADRSDAVHAIQSYLHVCTPQAIKTAVNAMAGARPDAVTLTSLGLGMLAHAGRQ